MSFGMAAVLKRLLTLALALAFLVGATGQFISAGLPHRDAAVRADMAAECAAPQVPCTGHKASCIAHLGCLTVPALAGSPVALAIPFRWTSVAYHFAATALSGLSVKPELSPPILAA